MAEKLCPEWTVVVADEQFMGRGRHGKHWVSPRGGLWFSVVLRPALALAQSSHLQFYAANSVRTTLGSGLGLEVGVKWPNDLLVDGRKIGGVLIETKSTEKNVKFAIIGVGLNMNVDQALLPPGAASVHQIIQRPVPLESVLQDALEELKSAYKDLSKPQEMLAQWWKHCVHRDKTVTVDTPGGRVIGVSVGLDFSGQLEVVTDDGLVSVSEGTLRL